MSYRRCRNPVRTDGPTMEQVIEHAIQKLGWPRKKVLSWYMKENPALNHSRPQEKVDRGLGQEVIDLLDKRERDRVKEDKKRLDKKKE